MNRNTIRQAAWAGSLLLLVFAAGCANAGKDFAQSQALVEKIKPSLVQVEYWVKYDKGEAPRSGGWGQRCPNCGQYHNTGLEELVRDQRPLEVGGFLLSQRQVLTADTQIQSRFVKEIKVRIGKETLSAKIGAYAKDQNAIILELDQPAKEGKTLTFDAKAASPYYAVSYSTANGEWQVHLQGAGAGFTSTDTGRKFAAAAHNSLVVNRDGVAVGAAMKDELSVDGSWKGSPLDWPAYSAKEIAGIMAAHEKRVSQGLLNVTLHFRSPKAKPGRESYRSSNDDENAPVQHVLGVLIGEKRLLILSELRPSQTARLEKIRVSGPKGDITAKFSATVSDYGCFVADLEKPMPGSLTMCQGDVRDMRNTLLPAVELTLQGEKRVCYFDLRRIAAVNVGWHHLLYPELVGGGRSIFLFTPDGKLMAFPVGHRDRVPEGGWRSDRDQVLTTAAPVAGYLADMPAHTEFGNIPLPSDQENRLAWLGVELQALNQELARVNNVSDLTSDGQSGSIVTFVYPDSPAAKAGVEAGWLLLRLNVAGEPKPMDVKVSPYQFADRQFPWERLDECPEQYYESIPCPWPSAENELTRVLTDLGFGTKFTAEFFHDGKIERRDFQVAQSPQHYDSAPRYKSEPLGLTVRQITYEVSRYFHRKTEDPGVIISKIETGSKASISGLKPYEIITHVNDKPVSSVAEFEKLCKDQKELRLSIKRMARGRIVKIDMVSESKPAESKPAESKPAKTPS